jgi:RNA polymerase sigma-70 factor (ECF subfamily)
MLPSSDEAVHRRLLAGDLEAFEELSARYERHLFGFICHQLGDPTEAEDVLHEVFLAILRSTPSARSFRAWLFKVARNLCLNRARTERRASQAKAVVSRSPLVDAQLPEEALEQRQRAEALARAVSQLPEAMGALYRLRASGLTYEELAEVLGIPVGTVKSRLHELVGRLREELPS